MHAQSYAYVAYPGTRLWGRCRRGTGGAAFICSFGKARIGVEKLENLDLHAWVLMAVPLVACAGFTASYRDPGGLFTMQVPCGWTQVPGIAPDTGVCMRLYMYVYVCREVH